MHSSDFFRAHWSRQLCCKALSTGKLMFSRLHLVFHRRNFIFNHSQSHPCGPGPCVGNKGSGWPGHWFECTAAEQPTSDRHRPGLSSSEQRTRPLTSYPVSQSHVLPTKSRSWSRVFTDQEGRKCVLQNSHLL